MAVFDAREVAAKKTGAFFDIALGHALLKPEVADGLADIHGREHFRMGHSNQSGNFWQGEICAMRGTFVPSEKYMGASRIDGPGGTLLSQRKSNQPGGNRHRGRVLRGSRQLLF
jgi:hypothetical protein